MPRESPNWYARESTQPGGSRQGGSSYRNQAKPDYREVHAFRVIALLDSLRKLVEKTVAHLIVDQLERGIKLPDGQLGCRKDRRLHE